MAKTAKKRKTTAKKTVKKASKASKKAKPAKRASTAKKKSKMPARKTSAKKATAAKKKKVSKAKPAKVSKKAKPVKKAKESSAKTSATPKKNISFKGSIPLSNPAKLFMEIWSPESESFLIGIQRLFTEYEVPGKNEKQKEENSASILEKIEAALRKEPLPKDILEQLTERFATDRVHQIGSIMSMKPRSTIRLNVLKADIQGFAQSTTASDLKVKRCQYSPYAFDIGANSNPLDHPAYEKGLFEVEDEASQWAALLVNARPGQRILDLCAREGDHTLAISAMMKNKGSLFVYDADSTRLRTLKAKALKAKVDNIRVLGDGQVGEVKGLDAVLIDAPCSGSGVLARQPELKWRFKTDDLTKIHKVQAALLREGARKLKMGGHLVYVTSSLSRSENEGQIEHFMKQGHNSYRIVPIGEYLQEAVVPYLRNFFGSELTDKDLESFMEADPFFTMLPDVHGSNGMFAAVIQRTRISN